MNHQLDIQGTMTEYQYEQIMMEVQKNKFFGAFVGFFFVAMGGWALGTNGVDLRLVLLMALFTAVAGVGITY